MTQLAQFSALEQQTDTNQSIDSLVSTTSVNQAIDLIGRDVTYTKTDGTSASGVADTVSIGEDGTVSIDVGGQSVDPTAITNVVARRRRPQLTTPVDRLKHDESG